MKITENFTLEEFTGSSTAKKLCIPNLPNLQEYENIKALCRYLLQPLRDLYGKPIRISSGFRSLALNAYVGGAPKSQHLTGQAADIVVPRQDMPRLFALIAENLKYDQLIWETRHDKKGHMASCWIHVSFCLPPQNNRQQMLHCPKPGVYTRIDGNWKKIVH